jgi:hypothetical protein
VKCKARTQLGLSLLRRELSGHQRVDNTSGFSRADLQPAGHNQRVVSPATAATDGTAAASTDSFAAGAPAATPTTTPATTPTAATRAVTTTSATAVIISAVTVLLVTLLLGTFTSLAHRALIVQVLHLQAQPCIVFPSPAAIILVTSSDRN